MVGKTLGHYEILELLGAGGMGEVYRVRDTTLGREVAIKVLPAEMAGDEDRRQRFEREAQAIAALDHPNIVTVHSIEHAAPDADLHFITMQLVEGTSLADVIPKHGFAVDRLLELAVPLVEGISAAHDAQIMHRDLKPANVMVGTDGRVRVLDFGLAKLTEGDPAPEAATEMATEQVARLTEEGKILGTVAYMSPEQAEGKAVDHRTDIFSLGIVLYEMATGELPFKGDTKMSVLSSIITSTPPSVTELNSRLPRHLGRIVRRCLEKDPLRRYQSALDLRNDLAELAEEVRSGEAMPVAGPQRATARPNLALAGVAAVVLFALGYLLATVLGDSSGRAVRWRTIKITSGAAVERDPYLSPDGEYVLYTSNEMGNLDIYRQRVGGRNATNLTVAFEADDFDAALSPDGETIAFRSERGDGGIYLMGATGEDPRPLTDFGYNPDWSPDGTEIVMSTQPIDNPRGLDSPRELWIVDVATEATRKITDEGVQPSWSPSGDRIAYFGLREGGHRDIYTISASDGEPVQVTNDAALDWSPAWSPEGDFLYFASDRGGSMSVWRVAIDQSSGTVRGDPESVTTPSIEQQGRLSIAGNGLNIAYSGETRTMNVQRAAFDPDARTLGLPEPVTRGSQFFWSFDVSSDGQRIVAARVEPEENLYIMNADGSELSRLTDDADRHRAPSWSPDGEQIFFFSDRSGEYQIWAIRPDGRTPEQITRDAPGLLSKFYPSVSPVDDRLKYVQQAGPDTRTVVLPLASARDGSELFELPPTAPEGTHFRGWQWAPDGSALAGWRQPSTGSSRGNTEIAVFWFDTNDYSYVGDGVIEGVAWLSDGDILFSTGSDLVIADPRRGSGPDNRRVVLSLAPDGVTMPRTTHDGRTVYVYFLREQVQADVYLLIAESQ